jgi:hypothetical protein
MTGMALAHHQAAQPFNGLFYATAAAVIPVLFLALVLQGSFHKILEVGATATDEYIQNTIPAIAQGHMSARKARAARA